MLYFLVNKSIENNVQGSDSVKHNQNQWNNNLIFNNYNSNINYPINNINYPIIISNNNINYPNISSNVNYPNTTGNVNYPNTTGYVNYPIITGNVNNNINYPNTTGNYPIITSNANYTNIIPVLPNSGINYIDNTSVLVNYPFNGNQYLNTQNNFLHTNNSSGNLASGSPNTSMKHSDSQNTSMKHSDSNNSHNDFRSKSCPIDNRDDQKNDFSKEKEMIQEEKSCPKCEKPAKQEVVCPEGHIICVDCLQQKAKNQIKINKVRCYAAYGRCLKFYDDRFLEKYLKPEEYEKRSVMEFGESNSRQKWMGIFIPNKLCPLCCSRSLKIVEDRHKCDICNSSFVYVDNMWMEDHKLDLNHKPEFNSEFLSFGLTYDDHMNSDSGNYDEVAMLYLVDTFKHFDRDKIKYVFKQNCNLLVPTYAFLKRAEEIYFLKDFMKNTKDYSDQNILGENKAFRNDIETIINEHNKKKYLDQYYKIRKYLYKF
jgi:hypothetical protein